MPRPKYRYRENIEGRQARIRHGKLSAEWNEASPFPPLYLLTDPDTADRIIGRGFAGSGMWSPQATVTLLDRVPGDLGGSVVRISLAPDQAKAAIACAVDALDDEFRRFVVPLELLKNAYVALFTEKR